MNGGPQRPRRTHRRHQSARRPSRLDLHTTPTVNFQPISGLWMVYLFDLPLTTPWIAASLCLLSMMVKKRGILAQRFFQARKCFRAAPKRRSVAGSRAGSDLMQSGAAHHLRGVGAICWGVAVSAAVSRLLPCKQGISAASFTRFFTAIKERT